MPVINRVLAALPAADLSYLRSNLTLVDLPQRRPLEVRNRPIEHIYFLDSGFASVVNNSGNGIEVGLIGREGMTGLPVVMGTDRSPHDIYMQQGGAGWQIEAHHLRRAMEQSRHLHRVFVLFAHAFAIQMSFTVIANGRNNTQERLARWLLMAHDRSGRDLTLTHKSLSLLLGVRRPGLTIALQMLKDAKAIRSSRGVISITDRRRLRKLAHGSYGASEAELERMLAEAAGAAAKMPRS